MAKANKPKTLKINTSCMELQTTVFTITRLVLKLKSSAEICSTELFLLEQKAVEKNRLNALSSRSESLCSRTSSPQNGMFPSNTCPGNNFDSIINIRHKKTPSSLTWPSLLSSNLSQEKASKMMSGWYLC